MQLYDFTIAFKLVKSFNFKTSKKIKDVEWDGTEKHGPINY